MVKYKSHKHVYINTFRIQTAKLKTKHTNQKKNISKRYHPTLICHHPPKTNVEPRQIYIIFDKYILYLPKF